jgi:PAS domain S-box-containing protein
MKLRFLDLAGEKWLILYYLKAKGGFFVRTEPEESKERLISIIRGIPDIVYTLDTEGNITFVNDAVTKYGYSTEGLVGTRVLDLVHPEDRKKAAFRINERRTGARSTKSLAVRLLRKQRPLVSSAPKREDAENDTIFLITAQGVYDSEMAETKNFIGTQGIAKDITEWKRVEDQVKQQNEFLNLVLESLPHPFYVINVSDYSISLANSAAQLSRISKEATCYALTHMRDKPCESDGHACPLELIKRTKKPVTVEHLHYDKDGNPRNVEIHAYPIFDSEGNVSQIIESALDITERRLGEMEREKLIADLQKALAKVKILSGLLPICASCKKIRDDQGPSPPTPQKNFIKNTIKRKTRKGVPPNLSRSPVTSTRLKGTNGCRHRSRDPFRATLTRLSVNSPYYVGNTL